MKDINFDQLILISFLPIVFVFPESTDRFLTSKDLFPPTREPASRLDGGPLSDASSG